MLSCNQMHSFQETFSNLAYLLKKKKKRKSNTRKKKKKKNSKPCNTPSDQVHALLEFQQAQPHLHNRIKLSQNSLLLHVCFFSSVKATQPCMVTYQ